MNQPYQPQPNMNQPYQPRQYYNVHIQPLPFNQGQQGQVPGAPAGYLNGPPQIAPMGQVEMVHITTTTTVVEPPSRQAEEPNGALNPGEYPLK